MLLLRDVGLSLKSVSSTGEPISRHFDDFRIMFVTLEQQSSINARPPLYDMVQYANIFTAQFFTVVDFCSASIFLDPPALRLRLLRQNLLHRLLLYESGYRKSVHIDGPISAPHSSPLLRSVKIFRYTEVFPGGIESGLEEINLHNLSRVSCMKLLETFTHLCINIIGYLSVRSESVKETESSLRVQYLDNPF
jgi:hypothetical protein